MKNQLLLQQLKEIITTLSLEVANQKTVLTQQPMFDNQLFKINKQQQHYRLSDYVIQLEDNYTQLSNAVLNAKREVVDYLMEKLLAQISAIKKELASQKLRKGNLFKSKNTQSLHQQIAQHHDYERRLANMIFDRSNQLNTETEATEHLKIQREIIALEKRLQRCRQALISLEQQLE